MSADTAAPREGRRCTSCGAHVQADSGPYCTFCGAELPLPDSGVVGDVAARFAALAVHPEAIGVKERPPGRSAPRVVDLTEPMMILVGGVFAILLLLGLIGLAGIGPAGGMLDDLSPLAFVGLIGFPLMIFALIGLLRMVPVTEPGIPSGPTGWRAVRVLGLDTDEVGVGQHRRLVHHATLEDMERRRSRVEVPDAGVRRTLAHDDMGLAWVDGGTLVDYVRVDV